MQVLHQGGGAGSVASTLHLSLGLQRSGADVVFVCPPASEVEALAAGGGLTVVPLALEAGERRANAAALAQVLANYRPVLVNSQSARDRAALTWLRLSGRLPAPLVLTRRQMPRTFFLENWITSRSADRVIAVSHAVARALRRRGTPARKLAVIHNGLIADRVDRPVSDRVLFDWRDKIGWTPAQRDQYYNVVKRHDGPDAPDLIPDPNPRLREVKQIDKTFIGRAPGMEPILASTEAKRLQLNVLGE